MTIHFKITTGLLEEIRNDLLRRHSFAFERVGFLFICPGTAGLHYDSHNSNHEIPNIHPHTWYSRFSSWFGIGARKAKEISSSKGSTSTNSKIDRQDTLILLASSYAPVTDGDYIEDPTVGARIGSAAIRSAMQRSLDSGMGVLHVHMHEGRGRPGFSLTDRKSMNSLMPSFFNITPNMPHGALVLNRDSIAGVVWKDKKTQIAISRVSVIGYPCSFDKGISYV